MSCEMPCISYMALYIISMHIINTNSRTSTHWKLNVDSGKVQAAASGGSDSRDADLLDDPLLSLLTSKTALGNGEWKLEGEQTCKEDCQKKHWKSKPTINGNLGDKNNKTEKKKKKSVLDCGKPVNFTQYDHLRGISERKNHREIPEPDVAMLFRKDTNMSDLEKKLRRAKKEKPKSVLVYNQIGNFWRIKGNTQLAIECFRKALSISPNNPDVLLSLARVLFNLQYLDDAIALTRRSLEYQSPDQNSWLQHFTLGEILKAYGHDREAILHFEYTLDLKPGFQPAQAHLREMEINPDGTVTYYTLFIILFLVLGVLCGILTSIDSSFEDLAETKTQRHFNRAMAMRSIKLGINPKLIRMRKQYNC